MKVPFTPVCAPNVYFGGSRFHVATRDKRLKIPKQMEKSRNVGPCRIRESHPRV